MRTPDYLIGVGEGGSRTVETFMEREWVLEEVIHTDKETDVGDQLIAMTIDSAEQEIPARREKEEEIATSIVNIYEAYHDDTGQNPPYPDRENFEDDQELLNRFQPAVNFHHINFSEILEEHEYNAAGLTADNNVKNNLERAPGLEDTWWLENHSDLVAQGLQSGVERRRTLSKALYHISAGATDPNHPKDRITPNGGDTITIVVALGGGTGSGTVIDLAKDITANQPDASIDLIGILPDTDEDRENTTNAHASLSELEFLAMSDNSPFRTMTLVPYPNDREGTEDRDFEQAMADVILTNNSLLSTDAGEGAMAPLIGEPPAINLLPFNIAIPHTVQFDPEIKEASRNNIAEFIKQRESVLGNERQVYETIENYLDDSFPQTIHEAGTSLSNSFNEPGNLPNSVERELYRLIDRIEQLDEIFSDEQFEVAGFKEEVNYVRERLLNQYNGAWSTDLDLEDIEGPINEAMEAETIEYAPDVISGFISDKSDFEAKQNNVEDPTIYSYLVSELETIELRDKLLGRLYETSEGGSDINAEEENYRYSEQDIYDNLDETILTTEGARLIRSILTEDVLNPNRSKLSDAGNTSESTGRNRDQQLEDLIERVWNALHEKELEYQQLNIFEDEVIRYLQDSYDEWKDNNEEQLDIVQTYHEHYADIAENLDELQEWAGDLANDLNDFQEPPSELDYPEETISEVESTLEKFGLGERIKSPIYDAKDLTEALRIKNQSGFAERINPIETENERRFKNIKENLNQSHGKIFRINSGFSDEFQCVYTGKFKNIKDEIESDYDSAVDTLTNNLKSQLSEDRVTIEDVVPADEDIKSTTIKALRDRGSTRISAVRLQDVYDGISSKNIEVPTQRKSVRSAAEDVKNRLHYDDIESLKNKNIESESDLLEYLGFDPLIEGDTTEVFGEDTSDLEPIKDIIRLWVHPIREEISNIEDQLDQYGRDYTASQGRDDSDQGLYDALGRLYVLAEEREQATLDTEDINKVSFEDNQQVRYGPDLTAGYKELVLGKPDIPTDYPQNPLVQTISADTEDLVNEPSDIGESSIWDNRESQIKSLLSSSIIGLDRDIRVPVNLSLSGIDNLQPASTDLMGNTFDSLNVSNIYLSRIFDEDSLLDQGAEFADIEEDIRNELSGLMDDGAAYYSGHIANGGPWTISMVTFVSAFSLDMFQPERDSTAGYKTMYEMTTKSLTHEWKHHALGLDGNWANWDSIEKFINNTEQPEWWGDEPGGAFLRREFLLETSEAAEFPIRTRQGENPDIDWDRWETLAEVFDANPSERELMAYIQNIIAEEEEGGLSIEQAEGIFLSRYDVEPVKSRYPPEQ